MSDQETPKHYQSIKNRFPEVAAPVEQLGKAVRERGPLDEKTAHIVQLAAAAAIQSEGSAHSHVRRALAVGATPDELYHAALLLVTTIGFPRTAALISWIDDVVDR